MEANSTLIQGLSGALFIGLSGFLYLHGSFYQRFQHASAGQQVKASLAFAYGTLFLIISLILLPSLKEFFEYFPSPIRKGWAELFSVLKLHAAFFAAPIVALVAAVVGNAIRLVQYSDEEYMVDRLHPIYSSNLRTRMKLSAVAHYAKVTDDRMLATLWRAVISGKLIQITLKSRKVYIGPPLASADPSLITGGWLKIVPLVSGFRDKDTLLFVETTNYLPLFEGIANNGEAPIGEIQKVPENFDKNDLGILVPWSEISSLTIHDPALDDFFSAQSMDSTDEEDLDGSETQGEFSGSIGAIDVTVKLRKDA